MITTYTIRPFNVAACVLSVLAMTNANGRRTLIKFSPLLLLVYFQLAQAYDTERILVLGFPALIILSTLGVRELVQKLGISPWYFVPLPLLLTYWNLYVSPGVSLEAHLAGWSGNTEGFAWVAPSPLVPIAAQTFIFAAYLAVAFVLAWWLKLRSRE